MRTPEESDGDDPEVGVVVMVCFPVGEGTVGSSFFTMLNLLMDVVDRVALRDHNL